MKADSEDDYQIARQTYSACGELRWEIPQAASELLGTNIHGDAGGCPSCASESSDSEGWAFYQVNEGMMFEP